MKKGFVSILAGIIIILPLVFAAQGAQPTTTDYKITLTNAEINFLSCSSFNQFKDTFIGKSISEKVPFKDEIFNIYVGGEPFGYLEIQNRVVTDFGCEIRNDSTYNIYMTDYKVLREILQHEDKTLAFIQKIKTKEIQIKGQTFTKKIKWAGIKFALIFVKVF